MNVTKQEIWHTRQGIYGFSGEKVISGKPQGWKIEYFPQVEDHLIQKHWNISIRCLVYSQILHCWLVAESFLVWQKNNGGVSQGRSKEFFGRWLKIFKSIGHHGWPAKEILGCGTARAVNSGPFSMRLQVL